MSLANFNDATAYVTFPALSITDAEAKAYFDPKNRGEASVPIVGDPGFIIEQPDGSWSWESGMEAAKASAGSTGAIYQSWEVCDYFKQFAEEATIDPKTGKETLTGPLKE